MPNPHILRDQKLWFDGFEFTGVMSAMALDYGAEVVDRTAFGSTTRQRLGGLKTVTAQHEGFFDADPFDEALFSRIGVADTPMSFAVDDAVEGSVAYSFLANLGEYSPGAQVGEMYRFSVGAEASGSLIRGTLMHDAVRTTSANGTARQLGAVASGQTLYAALHVTAVSGTTPTLDVTVESDDLVGFATPTTRMTFAQKIAIGSQWLTLAGPVTDDWWRIAWSIGGGGPSFDFAVFLGIQ